MTARTATGPAVTVVIPVWDDYCALLPESVDSALSQEGVSVEVLVVDNSSTVPLPALGERTRTLRTPRRLSAGAARNVALPHIRTPLVMFLDADDRLLPGALATLVGVREAHPGAVAAIGKRVMWNPETGEERINERSPRPLVYHLARLRRLFALMTLRFDVFQLTGCALLSTEAVRDAGGFGDASLAEDWILRSALATRGRIAFARDGVVRYRVSEGSLWYREHSREELMESYEAFRTHRLADPRLPRWARLAMPIIAREHRRDVARMTRHGGFTPTNPALGGHAPRTPTSQLSVVVCTRDRPEDLADCLEALAALGSDFEVVVVDSASAVPCQSLVERFRDRLAALRYVHSAQPGVALARNIGLQCARGSVIAYVDDDVAVQPGWDSTILRALDEHPDVGCVGGRCLPRFAGERPRWLSDRLLQLVGISRFRTARHPRSSVEWPPTANIAFRRQALEAAGPFDVGLVVREDYDMIGRLLATGWQVWLEPAASALHTVHVDRLSSRYYWRRLWINGTNRAKTPSLQTGVRLAVAVPIRLALLTVTRDRVYLYRLAESAGYFAALLLSQ